MSTSTTEATVEPTLDEAAALRGILLNSTALPQGTAQPAAQGTGGPLGGEGTAADLGTIGSEAPPASLDGEATYLQRNGREPSNDEILQYIERHHVQEFLSDIVMCVAKYMPPDPFEFMLDHLGDLAARHREAYGLESGPGGGQNHKVEEPLSLNPSIPDLPPEERGRIVRYLATMLQSEETAKAAAAKRLAQFGSDFEEGRRMTRDGFSKLLDHMQEQLGLDKEDAKLMSAKLQHWRFRSNAVTGKRGLPLWPMAGEDFVDAWPSVLRVVRDRYVPIGGNLHRSLFIRRAAGEVTDKYTLGRSLGRGAFGEVMLVTHHQTNQRRVLKRVDRIAQKLSHEQLLAEVELLTRMDHPHIIRLFEFFETDEFLDMIMEPVYGGTLTHLVNGLYCDGAGRPLGQRPACLNEGWVATVMSQLLGALAYAHDVMGVIHKDLKTDNVLLVGALYFTPEEFLRQPVHSMLADFGIAEIFASNRLHRASTTAFPESETAHLSDVGGPGVGRSIRRSKTSTRSKQVGGTPSYMSPEMFSGSFTEKCDIWSLGVIMFQILTGQLPYQGANILMQGNIVCDPRRHPPWDLVSKYKWSLGARWCCQQLLSKDESVRPDAATAQRDTWLTKAAHEFGALRPAKDEVQALKQQHLQSHLMKMALNCLASQLNLSQMHYLNLRFKQYDISGDGRLSHIEMRQALEDVGVSSVADAELIIESLDGDHNGSIEYTEFVAGCLNLGRDTIREQLRIAFEVFDLDGNGTISLEELRHVLTGSGQDQGSVEAGSSSPGALNSMVLPDGTTPAQIMRDLDANGSNQVEYAEFEAYLLREHARMGQELQTKQQSAALAPDCFAEAPAAALPASDSGGLSPTGGHHAGAAGGRAGALPEPQPMPPSPSRRTDREPVAAPPE